MNHGRLWRKVTQEELLRRSQPASDARLRAMIKQCRIRQGDCGNCNCVVSEIRLDGALDCKVNREMKPKGVI